MKFDIPEKESNSQHCGNDQLHKITATSRIDI